jgi:hypothetical protein
MKWPRDIKNWTWASIAAFAISFTISLIAHVPKERAIVGSTLAAILVFSGFFFRFKGRQEK